MALGPTIVARFVADTSRLSASLDSAEKEGSSKFASLGKAAGAMAGAFVAAAAVDFASEAISKASDLEESISKVNVVFAEGADSILKWSETAAANMGMSRQKALEAAGSFGNLAVSLGLPQQASVDMSKNLVELAADLGSFNNVPVDEALAALKSGLTGETEPLKKFGVNMNDASLKAKALSMGLVESSVDMGALSQAQENSEKASRKAAEALKAHGENSVEYKDAMRDAEQANTKLADVMEGKVPAALTAAQKAQAGYALITEQTTTAQGDFSRTSDGLANSTKTAGAKFEDLQAKIGEKMLPAMTAIVGFIADKLIPGIESLGGPLSTIGEAVGSFINVLTDNKDAVMAVLIGIGTVLAVTVVPAMIATAAAAAVTFAIWLVGAIGVAAATMLAALPFILIGAAVALLAFIIIKNWDTIVKVIGAAWEWIKSAATSVWDWIKTVFGWIVNVISAYIGIVVATWKLGFQIFVAVVTTLWDWIKTVFGWIVNVVMAYVGILITTWTVGFQIFSAVVTTLWDWITTVFGWIVTAVMAYVGFVVGFWTGAWEGLKLVVTTLWDWISTVFGWIKDAVTNTVNTVVSVFTTAWDTVKNGVTAVWTWVTDKFNAISDAVHTAVNNLIGWVEWGWDQIKAGATAVWQFVTDKWQAIADAFHAIIDKIADTARQIVDAIKGPINSIIGLWNNLAFEIPTIAIPEVDLGPLGKYGGGTLGGFRIDFPDIPQLAGGGVLRSPTLFVGGEAGTEIVAPEAMLRTIIHEEGGASNYTLNIYPRTADASDIAYGFRRLELLAGMS
jgi:phage-related protein